MKRPLVPALLLTGVLAAGCSGEEAAPVQVEEVQRASVEEVVDAPGTVTARATSTLTAPADGTVAALLVADGATVEAGAVLVQLESPAAQERLSQARAAQATASTRVELPQADFGPVQDQLDAAADAALQAGRQAAALVPDPVLQAEVLARVQEAQDRYAAAASAARSAVDAAGRGTGSVEDALNAVTGSQRAQAGALVSAAEATVDALVVKAPIGGVVTFGSGAAAPAPAAGLDDLLGQLPPQLQGPASSALGGGAGGASTATGLAVGAPVTSGQPLLTVTDVSGLGVVAEVDETDVLLVTQGTGAGVELDAVPGTSYDASVVAVDVAPTPGQGGGVTYRVRLDIVVPEGGPRPLPGMSAIVDLRVRQADSAVSVPSAAVLRDAATEAVIVLEDGTYRRREVEVGVQGEDRVEVLSGLQVGERIVTRDADRLTDGQREAG